MGHNSLSIMINAPVDKVHEIAADPHRRSSWFVNMDEPEKVEGDGGLGTMVKTRYRLAPGIRFPVTTRIVEQAKTATGGIHSRIENEGPVAGWMTWEYEPSGDGTLVSLVHEYKVPGKAIGRFIDRVLLEKQSEKSDQQSLENLKLIAES